MVIQGAVDFREGATTGAAVETAAWRRQVIGWRIESSKAKRRAS